MNQPDIITRLDKLEDAFLSGLQEVRIIKLDVQKHSSESGELEPLLEADEVAKILGVDTGYVYNQARAKKIPSVKLGKYPSFHPRS